MKTIIDSSSALGVDSFVIGMPHRSAVAQWAKLIERGTEDASWPENFDNMQMCCQHASFGGPVNIQAKEVTFYALNLSFWGVSHIGLHFTKCQ